MGSVAYKVWIRDSEVEIEADWNAGHSVESCSEMHCPLSCAVAKAGMEASRAMAERRVDL